VYRKALAEAGALDFDEQIYRSIEILLSDPDARTSAQSRCRHLLVDEFQDLNAAHMLLIRLLCAPAYDCFGVGDDDQVIYGYAGATPEYLINFQDYFPGAHEYALEVNYRCPPQVVTAANNVLSYNRQRIPKVIKTPARRSDTLADFGPPLRGRGSLSVMSSPAAQLPQTVAAAISAWRAGGVEDQEIAVLSRVNSSLLPVQIALTEAGIPCDVPLGPKVLQRTGIRTALAYLRMALAPGEIFREDLLQTIRRPSRGIAPNVVNMLSERSVTSVADIRRLANRLSGRDVPKLSDYADSVESVVVACRTSAASALRAIRVQVGLGETMDVLDSSRREADRSTHADDLLALESVASLHPDVATFETWLRGVLERRPPEGPAVLLSTIHKIKGREWEHVVVYGVSKGLLPHRLSDDEEGERRVFHVAITRAIRQVLILSDADEPSAFVYEIDGSRPHNPISPARVSRRPEPLGRSATSTGKHRDRVESRRPGPRRDKGSSSRPATPVVAADVGLVIEYGGHTGSVVDLADSAAVIQVGGAQLEVPFGSDVKVQGLTVMLGDPRAEPASPGSAQAYEGALREWRSEVAKRATVPAYVVLNDRELVGIAARRPTTLAELARCKGMGPVRLERWGDELLGVLNGVDGD
jgi:DNA helicase II / ATP-dependent DNA helicase PcrA